MALSICLDTRLVRIGSTSVFIVFTETVSHPEAQPPINISQPSKPQSSTVTSTDGNGLNAHGMTMTGREQSSLHHLVAWLALMVLCLQHVEDMIWMVARCIERKTGNRV
jgi:hypothetical protein